MDQFVTRFLLKETANQTQSLLSSVESAVDAIDEQTNPARSSEPSSSPSASGLTPLRGVEGKEDAVVWLDVVSPSLSHPRPCIPALREVLGRWRRWL